MGTTYEKADSVILKLAKSVMRQFHPDLVAVELRLSVLMAIAARDDKGKILAPAVKLHGHPCAALVKIISYKDRVAGMEDAQITIDADEWVRLIPAEREALLDHELYHLEVQRDEDGNFRSDDAGRPKLKMKMHDHEFGWFDVIARRHGDASYEVKQAKAFADSSGQLYFGWAKPPEVGGVESATVAAGGKSFADKVEDALTAGGVKFQKNVTV